MKFVTNAQVMLNALNIITRVNNGKQTMPLLESVMVKVKEDGKVSLTTATKTEERQNEAMTYLFMAESFDIADRDMLLIDAKTLHDAVRYLGDKEIEIGTKKGSIYVKHDRCMMIVSAIVDDENNEFQPLFAHRDLGDKERVVKLIPSAKNISEGIRKVADSMAQDALRAQMCSVCLEYEGKTATLKATDGKRLSVYTWSEDVAEDLKFGMMIPRGVVKTLMGIKITQLVLLQGADHTYRLKINGNIVYTFKGIEGNYPNWRAIMPKESKYNIVCNRGELIGVLSRAERFTNTTSKLIALQMREFGEDTYLSISGKDAEYARGIKEMLPCEVKGEIMPHPIGMCATIVRSIITKMSSNDVVMYFNAFENLPMLITETIEGASVTHLLMPMRIEEKGLLGGEDEPHNAEPTESAEEPTEEPIEGEVEEDTESGSESEYDVEPTEEGE